MPDNTSKAGTIVEVVASFPIRFDGRHFIVEQTGEASDTLDAARAHARFGRRLLWDDDQQFTVVFVPGEESKP